MNAGLPQTLVDQLIDEIMSSEQWDEVYDIAKANSAGKPWLVGGRVYRTLAKILFSRDEAITCDFDFITEKTTKMNHIPPWWMAVESDDYGERVVDPYTYEKTEVVWRYYRDKKQVLDLMTFKRATQAGHEPSLDGYFKSVPLTVQAIALNIEESFLSGHGVQSVQSRVVKVNNLREAKLAAERAKVGLPEFVSKRPQTRPPGSGRSSR